VGKVQSDAGAARTLALAGEMRVVLGQLNRRLREQSHAQDLTGSQKSVLLRLERDGPATVTELARGEGVRSQSMGATVAALLSAGLVSGSPDPGDGRRTILSLTVACRELFKSSRAAKEDWLFRVIRIELTRKEREELTSALALLKRLADT
jgi:DNA-binding MarR family transcriptional regulator